MGITRAEFLRLLPAAVGHAPFRVEGDEIHGDGAPSWRMKLRELPKRRIALVALPVLDVELVIDASSGADAQAFVDRFLLGFQRAGG
jgi:hypothetical protein